uniref:Lymphotoxin-alpha n=1 Tax=Cyanoderma ruficeps TaxID=181631 RepID=A0A8C3QZ81_9PASS
MALGTLGGHWDGTGGHGEGGGRLWGCSEGPGGDRGASKGHEGCGTGRGQQSFGFFWVFLGSAEDPEPRFCPSLVLAVPTSSLLGEARVFWGYFGFFGGFLGTRPLFLPPSLILAVPPRLPGVGGGDFGFFWDIFGTLTPHFSPQPPRGRPPGAPSSSWPSPRGSLVWEAGVAPAVVRNGVRLRGNRLVVPRDGLYFVYAAAAFQGSRCPARSPRRPLRLAVSRLSPEYPRDVPLLRAARSVCRGGARGGLWAESLYQGAVFLLRRGDQLAATTTAGRFLDLHGAGQAYFGVLGVD